MHGKKITIVIALFIATLTVNAQKVYLGINYAQFDIDVDYLNYNVDPGTLNVKIGTYIIDNLSIEFRAGTGIRDDSDTVTTFLGEVIEVNTEIDTYIGLFVRGEFPISDIFIPFVVAGYSNVDATVSNSVDTPDDAISYGAGFEILLSDRISIEAEYM